MRFNIGLEDAGDLKADLERGFARLRAASEDAPCPASRFPACSPPMDEMDELRKPAGMHTLRLALMGLSALVAIFLGWTYMRQPASAPDAPSASARRTSPQDVAAMRRAIEGGVAGAPEYAGFFERLKIAYPAEYEGFLNRAAESAAIAGETPGADALMIAAARDLRSSHGVLAAKADGPALDHFFAAKRAMLDALAAKDQALCVDFLYGGGNGDFAAFSRDHRSLLAAMANAGLDAIGDGEAKRIARAAPNDEDFRSLEKALRAQGVSNAAIGALLDGKAPNPPLEDSEMCQAGQIFLADAGRPARRRAPAHLRLRRRADGAFLNPRHKSHASNDFSPGAFHADFIASGKALFPPKTNHDPCPDSSRAAP